MMRVVTFIAATLSFYPLVASGQNLHQQYGAGWSCSAIDPEAVQRNIGNRAAIEAGLRLREKCLNCERKNKQFFKTAPDDGDCVDRSAAPASKREPSSAPTAGGRAPQVEQHRQSEKPAARGQDEKTEAKYRIKAGACSLFVTELERSQPNQTYTWIGPCKNGLAEGHGVTRITTSVSKDVAGVARDFRRNGISIDRPDWVVYFKKGGEYCTLRKGKDGCTTVASSDVPQWAKDAFGHKAVAQVKEQTPSTSASGGGATEARKVRTESPVVDQSRVADCVSLIKDDPSFGEKRYRQWFNRCPVRVDVLTKQCDAPVLGGQCKQARWSIGACDTSIVNDYHRGEELIRVCASGHCASAGAQHRTAVSRPACVK